MKIAETVKVFNNTINKNLKYIYLFLVLPLILFQVFFTPPFQTPDSPNNFNRAYQISNFKLIGSRMKNLSGGYINSNMISVESIFNNIPFHYNNKVTEDQLVKAHSYKWHQSNKSQTYTFASFPNTSVYPPFAYLPQALAIKIGRLANLSILDTYRLSLLSVSLLAVIFTYLALSLGSRLSTAIFVTATLPMVTCLYAAVEADALLISAGFLLAAIIAKAIESNSYRRRSTIILFILITFLAIQKPSYIGLEFLFFIPGFSVSNSYSLLKRFFLASISSMIVISWIVYAKLVAWININPNHTSLISHIYFVLHNPYALITIFTRTLHSGYVNYYHQMVGVLGWLDTPLPNWYYIIVLAAFALTVIMTSTKLRFTDWLFISLSISTTILMVFIALYADWSPVYAQVIEGVQGRYFLPILPLSFMIVAPITFYFVNATKIATGKINIIISKYMPQVKLLVMLLLYFLFPLITYVVTVDALISRYYLTI